MMGTEGEKKSESLSSKVENQQIIPQSEKSTGSNTRHVIQKHGALFQKNHLKDVQVVCLQGVEVGQQQGRGLLFVKNSLFLNFVELLTL